MRVLPLAVLFASAAVLAVLVSFDTSAQVIDANPCQRSCYQQKSACVSECGSHTNTVECEAGCDVELESCLRHCR